MYKLMIVDDEKNTRQGLKKHIPWNSLNIDVVGTAQDGFDALELAKQTAIDILLTDIRMPKMDGIELAYAIRLLYPECKIIFLSGYCEKEYYKSAIQLKAISFLEKPMKIDEIILVMDEVVRLCDEEEKRKAQMAKLSNRIYENEAIIWQEFTLELIKTTPDIDILVQKHGDFFLKFRDNPSYTTLSVLLNWENTIDNTVKNTIKNNLIQILFNKSKEDTNNFFAGFAEDESLIILINDKIFLPVSIGNSIFPTLQAVLGDVSYGNFTFSIGVGVPVSGACNLHTSFLTATMAAKNQFYDGIGGILYPDRNETNTSFYADKNLYTLFKEAINENSFSSATTIVTKLESDARTSRCRDLDLIKNIFFNLLFIVYETAKERNLSDWDSENEKKYIWKEINDIKTLSKLSEYVLSSLETVFKTDKYYPAYGKIYEIKKYISTNFASNELSISSIANHVYLSQSYLCAFFKKATGKTLNEYITQVRMEKAKELLRDTRIKHYEIAPLVGISEANYFSTIFKKYWGHTPSEFKERNFND